MQILSRHGLADKEEALALAAAHSSCHLDLDWLTSPLATNAPWMEWLQSCSKKVSSAFLRLEPLFAQIAFPTAPVARDHGISGSDAAAVEDALLRLGNVGCHNAGCAAHGCEPVCFILLPTLA